MIKLLKFKYILYIIVCIFLGFTIFVNVKVSAATEAPYGKSITIQQILSDYQYFVNDNATILNHTVGGIVAGGNVRVSNFGDGAIEPSYFGNIVSVGNYNGTTTSHFLSGNPSYSKYVGLPVYYNSTTVSGLSSSFIKYTNSIPFIDLTSAFSTLATQSSNMANSSYTVTAANITGDIYNGYTLNLPLGAYKSVVIPKAIYDQVNYIKLTGISSLNDFVNTEYSISVIGVPNISISFAYTSLDDSKNTGKKGILFSDGQSFNNSNSLKNISSGNLVGGQLNTNGMKLIWNFPNATTLISDYTAGHIVAPNADVTLTNGTGNFEGGIIAKSIQNNSAEGHFYPYMAIGLCYTANTASNSTSNSASNTTSVQTQTQINNISDGCLQQGSANIKGYTNVRVVSNVQGSANIQGTKDVRKNGMPKTGDNQDASLAKFGIFFFSVALVALSITDFALGKKYSRKRNMK